MCNGCILYTVYRREYSLIQERNHCQEEVQHLGLCFALTATPITQDLAQHCLIRRIPFNRFFRKLENLFQPRSLCTVTDIQHNEGCKHNKLEVFHVNLPIVKN